MSKRIVMRIELTPEAMESHRAFIDLTGMTLFSVNSRLVHWFVSQPEPIQQAILRRPMTMAQEDLRQQIIRHIASSAPENAHKGS